jgi:hypothetical protein
MAGECRRGFLVRRVIENHQVSAGGDSIAIAVRAGWQQGGSDLARQPRVRSQGGSQIRERADHHRGSALGKRRPDILRCPFNSGPRRPTLLPHRFELTEGVPSGIGVDAGAPDSGSQRRDLTTGGPEQQNR